VLIFAESVHHGWEASRSSASKGDLVKKSPSSRVLKLHLNRETLRVLELPQLGKIAGGVEEDPSVTVKYTNCGSCNTGG
jgi:hypothetical protein